MAALTREDVGAHSTDGDCWISVHGKVYNVTKFLEDHPGGREIILEVAGQDATGVFEEAAHSSEARDILPGLLVGHLRGYRNAVQTFDSFVGRAGGTEPAARSPWKAVVLGSAALSLAALATWGYGRKVPYRIDSEWAGQWGNVGSLPFLVDPVWVATVVVLLAAVGAFGTFVSHIIYVDFGRLERYPSRMTL
ncbi:hypothetical protein LQW54_010078 [Pestalotiopsis sp. IQ-011]